MTVVVVDHMHTQNSPQPTMIQMESAEIKHLDSTWLFSDTQQSIFPMCVGINMYTDLVEVDNYIPNRGDIYFLHPSSCHDCRWLCLER